MEDTTSGLEPGLYIVAGPIGNLGDLSPRGAQVLRLADVIAVEDTRVSARLLRHAGSDRPMIPYHDHSAEGVRTRLIERMASESVALLSDAGTPLISDPATNSSATPAPPVATSRHCPAPAPPLPR